MVRLTNSTFMIFIFISALFILVFITFKGTINTSFVQKHSAEKNTDHNNHHRHNNHTAIQLVKVYNYLDSLRMEVKKMREALTQFHSWKEFDEYRRKLWSLFSNSSFSYNTRNPHILYSDVRLDCNTKYKLLLLISSNAPHFHRRELIRSVWGNHSMWTTTEKWKVVFILGGTDDKDALQDIRAEAKRYRDIVLEDVAESFYHLSSKVMIGLHWAISAMKFDFVLKCDDDVFVQIDRLMTNLNGPYKNEHYIGHVMSNQPVERSGRYALSKEEHEKDFFDPYCSGGGFVLSYHVIQNIIPLFNWTRPLKIDDAYIGELVFRTGVKAFHVEKGFYMWNTWCEYNEHLLVSHPVKQKRCLTFLQNRSLHDNGILKNDALELKKYGLPPVEEPKSGT